MKTKLLFLCLFSSALINGQVFTWDNGIVQSFPNDPNISVSETVAGVTCTFFASNSSFVIFGNFQQGTTGNSVGLQDPNTSGNLNFNQPINIENIRAFNVGGSTGDFEFVPFYGNTPGTPVIQTISTNASTVNLNWSNVSYIVINKVQASVNYNIGIDDITFSPCAVTIPDPNFKSSLLANTAINTNGNTEIECSEASSYSGTIEINNTNTADLTGIEAFIAATEIDFTGNPVVSADFSFSNAFTAITAGDNSDLITIDVSGAAPLETLQLTNTGLSSVDVSNNLNLEILEIVTCSNLVSLDVSGNTQLTTLQLLFTAITELDLSVNTQLTLINLQFNALTSLNVANGNNANSTFDARFNDSNLSCIQIDAGFTPPPPPAWRKDSTASYCDNCAALSVNDFDLNVIKLYPNPVSSILNMESDVPIKNSEVYSVLGEKMLSTNSKSIDVSQLNSGVYFLKVSSEDGNQATLRFIKD